MNDDTRFIRAGALGDQMNDQQKQQFWDWCKDSFDLSDQTLKQYSSFADKMFKFFVEHSYWFGMRDQGQDPDRLDNQSEKEIMIAEKQENGRSIRHVVKWCCIVTIIVLYIYR
jgi:hypothetical protein